MGDTWEWADPWKDARARLIGDSEVPQIITKRLLAKEVFNCSVRELDRDYSLTEIREAIELLTVEAEIQAVKRLIEERKSQEKDPRTHF